MKRPYTYKELHARVREMKAGNLDGTFENEDLVFKILAEVESIRAAVTLLMGTKGAEFATDILSCILFEVQSAKLNRSPEVPCDTWLFEDAADDEYLHRVIQSSLTPPQA